MSRPPSSVIGENPDILTQLLVCLPKKSLLRFRCVSKQWCALISDQYFIQQRRTRKYRHRSINGLFLHSRAEVCRSNTWKYDFISIDTNVTGNIMSSKTLGFTDDAGGIQIEQSCNGLLLCSTFQVSYFDIRGFNQRDRNYYVYNPTTEHYTMLFSVPKYSYEPYFSVSLAFNPIKSPYYKVICMLENAKDDCQVRIYSSETRSWKVIAHLCVLPNICGSGDFWNGLSNWHNNIRGSGVFWNGSLNWHNVADKYLVYFDIEREIFGKAPMPQFTTGKSGLYFGECKGHLYYIELSDNRRWIDIYERHYSTGWHVVHTISFEKLIELCQKTIGCYYYAKDKFKVLLIDGEETEEDYESPKLVIQMWDKVISCDLKNFSNYNVSGIEVLFVQGVYQSDNVIHAHQYIKSFASV